LQTSVYYFPAGLCRIAPKVDPWRDYAGVCPVSPQERMTPTPQQPITVSTPKFYSLASGSKEANEYRF
jgi:hypothetical protein